MILSANGSRYSRMDNLWKTAFKKFEMIWSALARFLLQILPGPNYLKYNHQSLVYSPKGIFFFILIRYWIKL